MPGYGVYMKDNAKPVETRSERAKRMRADGRFLPKNPGRPRKIKDETEIRRQSLMDVIQNGTARQKLDAAKQLEALDEQARAGGPARRDFSTMSEAEIELHLQGMVERATETWYADRILPELRKLFARYGVESVFDKVLERKAA